MSDRRAPHAVDLDERTTGRSVVVVSNPSSGGALDPKKLREGFAEHLDADVITWSPTTVDDPGIGQAAAAVADDADTVVACGGDGTVRAVMQSVAGTGTSLGIVPLGTGNLLASNFNVPTGLDAIEAAVHGEIDEIDVGVVNDERFAVMAGTGFDAVMIRDAAPGAKRVVGSLAYVWSGLRNLRRRRFHATVSVDGEAAWSGRAAMVLVGNCSSVTGGLEVFPDASPHDGVLDVAVLRARNLREWASVAWRLVRDRPQRPDMVSRFVGRTIEVELTEAQPYELDGEERDPVDRLQFTIEPAALKVRR